MPSAPSAPPAPLPSTSLWWAGLLSALLHGALILLPDAFQTPVMAGRIDRLQSTSTATTRHLLHLHLHLPAVPDRRTALTAQTGEKETSASAAKPVPDQPSAPAPTPNSNSNLLPQDPELEPEPILKPEPPPFPEADPLEPASIPTAMTPPHSGNEVSQGAISRFYPVDQLDQKPRLLESAELDTQEAQPVVATGILVLRLWINERGRVVNVEIEHSDLPPLLVRSAVTAFERMRFSPGHLGGQLVGSVLRVEVRYDDGRLPPPPPLPLSAAEENKPQGNFHK